MATVNMPFYVLWHLCNHLILDFNQCSYPDILIQLLISEAHCKCDFLCHGLWLRFDMFQLPSFWGKLEQWMPIL